MSTTNKRNSGFTLVELLVVIAIIGILVALLLPAVQKAREAARRLQCSNQVRQMTLAILNYESANKEFPTGGIRPWPNVEYEVQGLSWAYQILPYLEEDAVHDIETTEQIAATPVGMYFCPSRRGATFNPVNGGTGGGGYDAWLMDYAALVPAECRADFVKKYGNDRFFERLLTNDHGCTRAWGFWGSDRYDNVHTPKEKSKISGYTGFNGVIVRTGRYYSNATTFKELGYDRPTRMKKLRDGTSKTAMIAEKRLRTDDSPGAPDDDRGWSDGWDLDTMRSTICQPLQDGPRAAISNSLSILTAGSKHDAGFNVGFADGHVQFITYDIDLETWNNMGHRDDGQIVDLDF